MASEDAVYRESSQFRLWSFSPGQLADLRAQTNALAVSTIREARQRSLEATQTQTQTQTQPQTQPQTPPDDPLPLTPAEERLLLDFYTVELLRAGKFTEQPTDVQATAAVFFRRFYVTHSLMTYPPAALYKTALFFGAKAEGYYHKLDGFAQKFPHTTAADVLAGEFLLCQGIRFAFDVRHPFRALEGAVMELRRLADVDALTAESAESAESATSPSPPIATATATATAALSDTRISAAHRRAREILKFSPLITDAYFHFTPSQIMLAALRLADRPLADRLVAESFRRPSPATTTSKKSRKNGDAEWERIAGPAVRQRVDDALAECQALLAAEPPERLSDYWGQPVSNNLIKPLLKKLKACHDPDRWDLVALQQAKREGAVKAYHHNALPEDASVFGKSLATVSATPDPSLHEAKRRKVAKALDDPFGPPL